MRTNHLLARLALIVVILGGLVYAPAAPVRAAPPSNDDFDNAVVIGALPFTDTRDTHEATYADDDPQCTPLFRTEEATVWYRYTSASDQQVLISTAGSSYNATLAVFTGSRGSLSQVASVCEQPPSELRFDAVAATTYYIQVGVFTSQPVSNLALSLVAVPAPSNDDIAAATAIASLPYIAQLDVRAATASAGDPFCSGQGRTIWYKLTPSTSGRIMIANWGSTYSVVMGVYTGTPGALNEVACNLPTPNGRLTIDASAGITYYIVAGAEYASQAGELRLVVDRAGGNDNITAAFPVGDPPLYDERDPADLSPATSDPACFEGGATAWYRYTPTVPVRLRVTGGNANVGVYRGAPGNLSELACGKIDASVTFQSFVAINAPAGVTYFIGIGVPSNVSFFGPMNVRIRTGPGNDDFDAAAPVEALPFSAAADLRDATRDFDDPGCGGGGPYGGSNLWYVYHAVDGRLLEAIARATGFRAEVGIYTGTRGNLIQQACSVAREDPSGQSYRSAIFRATPGETYYISVGTSSSVDYISDARFTLSLDTAPPAPPNDDFDHPIVVNSLPYFNGQDGRIATTAPDDPQCGNRFNTYWYAYTPAQNEWVLAGTVGPVFGVYTGTRGHLAQLYCSGEPYQQFAFLDLTGGKTYYFMVAGGGEPVTVDWLSLQIERVPPPPPPLQVSVKIAPQANVLLRSGAARLTITVTCSREAWISIGGELSQRLGRHTISGPIGGWVYCTDTVTTTILVSPTRGRFVPLTANAAVSISSYDPLLGEVVSANASRVLLLQPALR